MSLNALSPISTARLSHHIMELRSTCWSLSTITRPCIWYEIPIAPISAGSYVLPACAFFIACCTCSHHISGDCSAQPGCGEIIGDSDSGYWADALHCCVWASTTETLIEDVPTSIPRSSIWQLDY